MKTIDEKIDSTESFAIYQALFDSSPDGISVLDINENKYVSVNKKKLELLGYTENEYLNQAPGSTLMEVQPDGRSLAEVSETHLGEVFENGNFTEELVLKHKDGSGIYCELSTQLCAKPFDNLVITRIKDITARKKHDQLVTERKNLLQAVFDNTKNGLLLYNNNTNTYEAVNKKFLDFTGFTFDEMKEIPVSKHFPEFQPSGEESLVKLEKHLSQLKSKGRVKHETWQKKKDGSLFLAEIISLRLPSPDEHLTLSIIEDLTEYNRSIAKVEESEFKLKEAASIAKLGYWDFDFENGKQTWSDEYYQILDLEPGSIKPSFEYFLNNIDEKDRCKVESAWQYAQENCQAVSHEYYIITQSKNRKHISGSYKLRFKKDGTLKSAFGALQDITEQRKTIDALAKSEARFRRLAENSPNVIFKFSVAPEPKLEYVSPAIERIFGYKPSELYKQQAIEDVLLIDQRLASVLGQYLFKGNWDEIITCQLKNAKGEFVWVEFRSTPIFNDQNEIVAFEGVIIDIDSIKKSEQKLLEQKVALETQNKDLEQFTYITSHDLRSPVVNITTLLNMFNEGIMLQENRVLLEKLKITSNKMYETLHDLIDVIAIEQRTTSSIEKIEFRTVIKDLRSQLYQQINDSNAIIKLDLKVETCNYIRIHIRSILQNLISNAIKYKRSDSVPVIRISTEESDDYLILTVKDNGMGMDLEKIGGRLFGMFQVFHNNSNGKGLGLFIIKRQVEKLGGKIEVESTPGVGTTFSVYLKVVR